MDPKWTEVFKESSLEGILESLSDVKMLCPRHKDILNAFKYTSFSNLHAVILGQDPYYTLITNEHGIQEPIADGLAFSSKGKVVPKSLKNIYKALLNHKLIDQLPLSSDLTQWAAQGILLLNTALTTLEGVPYVHKKLWYSFTKYIIKYISDNKRNIVFMLWGNEAQRFSNLINDNNHVILKYAHPSPLSGIDFNKCDHFLYVKRNMIWNPEAGTLIFTDGSQSKTGTGFAYYIYNGYYDGRIEYGNLPFGSTMQAAEGTAILKALQFIKANHMNEPITIITDSMLYINIITDYMHKWAVNNFSAKKDGGPIANVEIVKQLYDLYSDNITLTHVRSHKKPPLNINTLEHLYWSGNAIADKFATKREGDNVINANDIVK